MTDHNRENLALQRRIGELNALLIQRDDQMRELQHQLAAAKHDSGRLDWLQANMLIGSNVVRYGKAFEVEINSVLRFEAFGLRGAIDRAMEPA